MLIKDEIEWKSQIEYDSKVICHEDGIICFVFYKTADKVLVFSNVFIVNENYSEIKNFSKWRWKYVC